MTKRAVGYSRYSIDLQNERSIEDQESLIRRYAQLNGLTITKLYSDAALSGASIIGRDGLLQLLDDAKAGKFDAVIAEELDRLSRDMEDLAGIHKRLTFAGVDIIAVHEGVASTLTVGMRGIFGQLFREDNSRKVRRGLAGKVAQGLSAGGRAYGYRPDPANPGELIMQPEEADVIRRIFSEFLAGKTPLAIASGLNISRIAPPRATVWTASTIYGWAERRSGILRNDLYSGQIVWNKTRMVKDPETGKRVPRPNPESEWRTKEVPALRIIDDNTWLRVQELIRPSQKSPADRGKMRRPTRPLSGLLRCGSCGGGLSVKGTDKSGRVRVACARHEQSRTCPDPHTFYLDKIEEMTAGALLDEMDQPHLIELYVETYNAARREYAKGESARRTEMERRVAQLDAEVGRLVSFMARGVGHVDRLAQEYDNRCRELDEARAALALAPAPLDNVALHPAAIQGYRHALRELMPIMGASKTNAGKDLSAKLRTLVEMVTVFQGENPGAIRIEITGHLRALIDAPALKNRVWGAVVAREGLEPSTLRL